MRFESKTWRLGGCWLVVLTFAAGCGKQSTPMADVDSDEMTVAEHSNASDRLPTLAVPGPDEGNSKGKVARAAAALKSGPTLLQKGLFGKKNGQADAVADDDRGVQKPLEKGSPEWLLNEIQKVRLLPLAHEAMNENENEDEDSDEDDKPLTPAQEKKLADEIERNKGIRRERNHQIIKLAEECMQKTSKNPELEFQFAAAAHQLLDARLQLALQGDEKSIEALYDADKLFFERDRKSDSASEAALTVVNLAHANAVRYGRKDPRWLKEFSRQTQSYASRFPEESPRSIPLLMAAARSCEMNGQPEDAKLCYSVLSSKFNESPQGQQAANVLRRFQLKGQELELAGPGIDGGHVDVKTMKGKMVLVVFWASNAQPFLQQLPKLLQITNKYHDYLTVVGVNLDVDEKAVDAFVEANKLDWLQIFPENRQQRGWNSPLAVHYGVNMLPTMFLLDPNGIVAETNLDSGTLEPKIREVYAPFRKKTAAKQ